MYWIWTVCNVIYDDAVNLEPVCLKTFGEDSLRTKFGVTMTFNWGVG